MADTSLTALKDKITSATLIGNIENGSPEWHALRATGVGGSDVAAICKASPWNSAFKVWAVKTGKIKDDFVAGEAAEWGNRLESVIIDKFAEEHPELTIHRNVGTWANNDRPWQLANPDAIYETVDGKLGIIEIKTSRYEDDWTDQPPLYYQTQVQWYAQTFGFETPIYVVALFSGSKYREFNVPSDLFAQGAYLSEVEAWREYVVKDVQPDYDGSTATYETIRQLHPEIQDGDIELGDLWIHLSNALTEQAKAETFATELKSRVLDALGTAKRGTYDDKVVVTRQARSGGTPYLVIKKG